MMVKDRPNQAYGLKLKLLRVEHIGETMTTVQIQLPDQLAQEAQCAGLLAPESMERMLREQLRSERIARLKGLRQQLTAEAIEPMTPEEIQAEIEAYRAEQRRAAGA
jgi:hypothetical protein